MERKWKVKVKGDQSCPTLCDDMNYTVHGILQARILEWVAFPFSGGSSQPRDRTQGPTLQVDSLPADPWRKTKENNLPFALAGNWSPASHVASENSTTNALFRAGNYLECLTLCMLLPWANRIVLGALQYCIYFMVTFLLPNTSFLLKTWFG